MYTTHIQYNSEVSINFLAGNTKCMYFCVIRQESEWKNRTLLYCLFQGNLCKNKTKMRLMNYILRFFSILVEVVWISGNEDHVL